jgi:hypothetical protein
MTVSDPGKPAMGMGVSVNGLTHRYFVQVTNCIVLHLQSRRVTLSLDDSLTAYVTILKLSHWLVSSKRSRKVHYVVVFTGLP